ncbi:DUF6082 family protein [Couchioplanes caeruleus]|uniref:DUF6082 family protein n=1 Tax=Couchioplanes caeruleus TaxID=56438 RepID=UPI0020BF9CC9|nr:DUF6082 family protein [Couchioplanes caeruleus]UQU62367.1 DUF6082 family protein [Couchioplanes caeruleus]
MANDARGPDRGAWARLSYGLATLVTATLLTLLVGVGIAAALGQQGTAGTWSRWSDVGQTFGVLSSIISGLALVAVVLTARVQFRELQRSAAAELSMLHLEILKMSINDPQLAEVWPAFSPGLSVERNRQFLYANIIYQFHWTSLRLNKATDEEALGSMRYLFTSPLMRKYWAAAARARTSLAPGSPEHAFVQRLDDLCRDYEAAVAGADRGFRPAPDVEVSEPVRLADEAA